MDSYQDELQAIKTILKTHPKGMTVSDIAREVHTNRNSVAKYLDILLITGQAEMLTFGPAKVYFPSTRIPVSTLMDYSPDSIALLNKDLRIIQTNTTLLSFLGVSRTELIGSHVMILADTLLNIPELAAHAQTALTGKETTLDCAYTHHNHDLTLQIRTVPTTFDDGQPGVAVILADTTTQRHLQDQQTLADAEWQTTLDAVTDMVFLIDSTFTVQRINVSYAAFLGLAPEQCLGRKCYELLHHTKEAPDACLAPDIKTTRQPKTETFYDPVLDRHLQVTASPLFSTSGEFTGAVHVVKTVDKPKKTDKTQ